MRSDRFSQARPGERRGERIRLFGAEGGFSRRFEILKVLSRTHTGLTAEAYDRERSETVLLRILSSARLPGKTAMRLLREMATAKTLSSRFLWPVLDVGSEHSSLFVTSPLPAVPDLRAVARRAPLPVPEAIELIRQIAEGLKVLHDLGILHRNLHPETVLLDPESSIRLTGYGLEERWEAWDAEQVAYLAPEQAAYGFAHEESDLYSLGAIAFLLLTGHPPLERTSPLATAVAHVREKAPRVDALRPEVPRWLGAAVGKLLARNESERYGTAGDFLDDLKAQRAPRRQLSGRQKTVAAVSSLLVAGVILATLPQAPWNRSRLAVLAAGPSGGIVASDATGLVLWSRPDIRLPGRAALVPEGASGQAEVAAVIGEEARAGGIPMLSYLDGLSGTEIRRVALPVPSAGKRGEVLSVQFLRRPGRAGSVVAATLRESGSATHWTVLHSAHETEAALVYQSSTPHRMLGSLETSTGDSAELVIGGLNPWMGGYYGVAALPLDSVPSSSAPPELRAERIARPLPPAYALLPALREASLEAGRRAVGFENWRGRLRLLGEELFLRGRSSASPVSLRSSLRERAYELVLRARDQMTEGLTADALGRLGESRECAASAGDPYLLELIDRATLAIEGPLVSPETRDQRYQALFRQSESPVLAALDAASQFHESGDDSRAREWYLEGMRAGFGPEAFPGAREALLTGSLFLEAEKGGTEAVGPASDRLAAMFPGLMNEIERARRRVVDAASRAGKDREALLRERRRMHAEAGSVPSLFIVRRARTI